MKIGNGCILLVFVVIGCAGGKTAGTVSGNAEAGGSVWHHTTAAEPLRGVCLVVHGLNLNPARMDPLGNALRAAGMDVLQVYLAGHDEPDAESQEPSARMEAFRTVTLARWMTGMQAAYQRAQDRAHSEQVPLYYVGFSMGGLLGPLMLVSEHSVRWKKMVLLAPAIRLRARSHLVRALFLFPRLVIPSKSPARYRANRGTPVAAYHAMFQGIRAFDNQIDDALDIPTLILVDSQDEFVAYRKLEHLIARPEFKQWRLTPVVKDAPVKDNMYHHLIIDTPSLGETVFPELTQRMVTFLLQDVPAELRGTNGGK